MHLLLLEATCHQQPLCCLLSLKLKCQNRLCSDMITRHYIRHTYLRVERPVNVLRQHGWNWHIIGSSTFYTLLSFWEKSAAYQIHSGFHSDHMTLHNVLSSNHDLRCIHLYLPIPDIVRNPEDLDISRL